MLDPKDILTREEVARLLKVSVGFITEVTRGRHPDPLPFHKVGKYQRFYRPAVEAWFLARNRKRKNRFVESQKAA